jgi:hypothetical protein
MELTHQLTPMLRTLRLSGILDVNGHPDFPRFGHRKFPTPGFTPWPRRGGRGRP